MTWVRKLRRLILEANSDKTRTVPGIFDVPSVVTGALSTRISYVGVSRATTRIAGLTVHNLSARALSTKPEIGLVPLYEYE